MTPEQYKSARQQRGTQQGVAALLGVDYRTIQRRESGEIEITLEGGTVVARDSPVRWAAGAGRVPRNRHAKNER